MSTIALLGEASGRSRRKAKAASRAEKRTPRVDESPNQNQFREVREDVERGNVYQIDQKNYKKDIRKILRSLD